MAQTTGGFLAEQAGDDTAQTSETSRPSLKVCLSVSVSAQTGLVRARVCPVSADPSGLTCFVSMLWVFCGDDPLLPIRLPLALDILTRWEVRLPPL